MSRLRFGVLAVTVLLLGAACSEGDQAAPDPSQSTTSIPESISSSTSTTSSTVEAPRSPTTTLPPARSGPNPAYGPCGRELGFYIRSITPVPEEPTSHVATLVIVNSYGPSCSLRGFLEDVSFSDQVNELPTTVTHLDGYSPDIWLDLDFDPGTGNPASAAMVKIYTTTVDPDGTPCPSDRMMTAPYIAFTIPGTTRRFHTLSAPSGSPDGTPGMMSCDGRLAVTALAPFAGG